MGEVISLLERIKKKKEDSEIVKAMKDSLDNKAVMQRYNIQQPTVEERTERIRQSIKRINGLINELQKGTDV